VVRWPATLKVVGSPFHDSTLTEYVGAASSEVVWWVWLGGTQNHFLVQTCPASAFRGSGLVAWHTVGS
jgi:hypothetical protein